MKAATLKGSPSPPPPPAPASPEHPVRASSPATAKPAVSFSGVRMIFSLGEMPPRAAVW
ncbi:hypothetical protein ACFFX0_18565 [Citricoccus parietis]|uniref:Uncharacterized protein n=1 Tax=Citricoccus parietis TaxID=592307 RepID=A0ABV5G2E2_9MICC